MTQKRRKYPKEFKIDAVELLLKKGRPATEIARDLGIPAELLRRWKREYEHTQRHAFVGSGQTADPLQAELKAALKRAKDLEEERDILKKALAIFSKDAQ
ncbi:MAG: transposase [Candidatus Marinimicrobia bacterium]|jgi:transposase|nr:transposase [Candidatus Neomarinimicrobiota bacterium]MBT3683816.1 transposase [Candidatus Neomarinimicrobiota bacterium]MBT3760637.1 transposase [Candidatus Neomarinimicrobiota bacterium]MBT3894577.1 transposase [Candidatus Neomarinimicrobiota bacterium]MBT4173873.1 transposase [Candidatus Neomarinimicrobiota bacterium]